jgi:hypothetical protein
VDVLVGSTGYVGSHLRRAHDFQVEVHRSNVASISGIDARTLIVAGLPAVKWKANQEPEADWDNAISLAGVLQTISADVAILISTVDVYSKPVAVDERSPIGLDARDAYGRNRAWFECFFRSHFSNSVVLRLPGLYSLDVRKNLVHDLLHRKSDQLENVNAHSTFQFFDTTRTWEYCELAIQSGVGTLNVSSEPIMAQSIADLFDVELGAGAQDVHYDMRSIHAKSKTGEAGYFLSAGETLANINKLRDKKN